MKTIQWFPGHMTKTFRQIDEILPKVDITVQIIDARLPISSINPILKEKFKNKNNVFILNKIDFLSSNQINNLRKYFPKESLLMFQNSKKNNVKNNFVNFLKENNLLKENNVTRILVTGIPNVGKSTFINSLLNKNKLNAENRPGVTKKNEFVKLNDEIYFLDTPGLLWNKFDDQDQAKKLSLIGSIRNESYYDDDIILMLIDFYKKNNKKNFFEFYKLDYDQIDNLDPVDILLLITKKIGLKEDYSLASQKILNNYRNNKFGFDILD